jgi:hypothetical protein
MKRFLWFLTVFLSVIGLLIFFVLVPQSESAPQQCAGAAISMSLAVIPYCLARAFSEL